MSTYSKAYREVYFILKYISPRYYSKIPINVLNKIETEMDITYEPNVENNKWMDETKAIIYNLFKDYLATQEQKEILIGNEYLEIQNIEEKEHGSQEIEALVPEAEIIDYVTKLKSLTQASGFFNREFEGYEELPEFLKDKVIAENKVE